MSESDQRHLNRDSLFVMAGLRVGEAGAEHRVKVRNLSDTGLMAEGNLRIARGTAVSVDLRNIGWVDGAVVWVQDQRFGIAFVEPIDARVARVAAPASVTEGEYQQRRPLAVSHQALYTNPRNLRKI